MMANGASTIFDAIHHQEERGMDQYRINRLAGAITESLILERLVDVYTESRAEYEALCKEAERIGERYRPVGGEPTDEFFGYGEDEDSAKDWRIQIVTP